MNAMQCVSQLLRPGLGITFAPMHQLKLQAFHRQRGARFTRVNGAEVVNDYGAWVAEHAALRQTAGVLDLSFRSRLCLVGPDRVRFLHGQVTNDIKKLRIGQGLYTAITNAKGKMKGDANVFSLPGELLLDLEPGLTEAMTLRLEQYIVADDVRVVDAAPDYGLLSVQGPRAYAVIKAARLAGEIPMQPFASVKISDPALGEIYLVNHARLLGSFPTAGTANVIFCKCGFDLFVPNSALEALADRLISAAPREGGRECGWQALETARIEVGIPRFGADMDESNLPLECGLEPRAITYTKGCYIGQEVINRIHSVGHVNRELRGLRLADELPALPEPGDRLFQAGVEAGYITSAVRSPLLQANISLGYVRREASQSGAGLTVKTAAGESPVAIVELPFG